MRSCKSPDKPVRQVRKLPEGFELRHSFYMQETVSWSSKLTFSRKRWWGIAPVNVGGVGERHNIVKQTDFVSGGICLRKSRGGP